MSGRAPPTDGKGYPSAHGLTGSPRTVGIPFVVACAHPTDKKIRIRDFRTFGRDLDYQNRVGCLDVAGPISTRSRPDGWFTMLCFTINNGCPIVTNSHYLRSCRLRCLSPEDSRCLWWRRGKVEYSLFATNCGGPLTWPVLIALGIFYVLALGRGLRTRGTSTWLCPCLFNSENLVSPDLTGRCRPAKATPPRTSSFSQSPHPQLNAIIMQPLLVKPPLIPILDKEGMLWAWRGARPCAPPE